MIKNKNFTNSKMKKVDKVGVISTRYFFVTITHLTNHQDVNELVD